MENKKYTFWKFIQEHRIEIPIIQRDYAQGRIGKEELRKGFLFDLKNALTSRIADKSSTEMKLDFVYGVNENGTLNPLDGQQRLTTLWLLHWYIALNAGVLAANKDIFKKFSYETRVSSREFLQKLCDFNDEQIVCNTAICRYTKNCKYIKTLSETIQNQTWFYSEWKQDPTIQSMLRMLSGTPDKNGENIIDGIEKLFTKTTKEEFKNYWGVLHSDEGPIVFYSLDLLGLKQSDDLYIKMNARGEQLTSFENFKADLIGFIKEQSKNKLIDSLNGFSLKMDTDWTDVFWENKSSEYKIDDIYFSFLNRYFLNAFICKKDNMTYKYSPEEIDKENTFIKLYGEKSNDSNIKYTTFKPYKIILDESVLDALKNTLNNLYSYTRDNKLTELQKELIPSWDEDSKFRFIPEYNDNNVTTLTQPMRIVFFAICKFLEKETDKAKLKDWMRVVWNIVENSNIDTIPAMVRCMRLIDELAERSGGDILLFLSSENYKLISGVAKEQIAEEHEKAKKIIESRKIGIADDAEDSWFNKIFTAENFAFFHGAIRFLFWNEDGVWSWDDFEVKWCNVKAYFNENGIKKPDEANLLRRLIAYFDKEADFEQIYYDNSKDNWRNCILLNKKLANKVHNILVLNDLNFNYGDYKSIIKNDDKLNYVQNYLVRNKAVSMMQPESEYHHWKHGIINCIILYPSGAKAEWKKYLISHRIDILIASHGKITFKDNNQNKKEYIDSKLIWGKNIEFYYKYENIDYLFTWQHWDWIEMYDDQNRKLYDLYYDDYKKGFNIDGNQIKSSQDLINKLEECITEYKKFVDNSVQI